MTSPDAAHVDATALDSPSERLSVLEAVRSGRRAGLEALRDYAARLLENDPDVQPAPVMKQLREVLAELDQLPAGKAEGVMDELDRARTARLSAVGRSATPDLAPAAELLLNGGR